MEDLFLVIKLTVSPILVNFVITVPAGGLILSPGAVINI